jgi:hypothetical protein
MTEKNIQFSQAFDQTLTEFGLSAKWLSEKSGVSQQMISGFRKGHQRVYSDSLEKMIATLPSEARQFFFEQLGGQLSGQFVVTIGDPASVVDRMNSADMAKVLTAIANRLEPTKVAHEAIPA